MRSDFTHSQAAHVVSDASGELGRFEHVAGGAFSNLNVTGYRGEMQHQFAQCGIGDGGAPELRVVWKPGTKVLVVDEAGNELLRAE